MNRFSDLSIARDDEGVLDLEIDASSGDLVTTAGLDRAVVVLLLTDRRARADEVSNPMQRRGWIGDLLADTRDDRIGSGLWLFEQAGLTGDTRAGVRGEAVQAHEWMVKERLTKSVDASVEFSSAVRRLVLRSTVTDTRGGQSIAAFDLWAATQSRILFRSA